MARTQRGQNLLIKTKLNRPSVWDQWVSRERLIAHLDEGLTRRLTLITAPAGYGKTALTAQWLGHCATPSAWLSLDKNDSDPERFLRYVIAALRTVVSNFGATAERWLATETLPPADYITDAFVADLAVLESPLLLVLDDYHAIESEVVDEIMSRLVQYLPEELHLIVLSRVEPSWPLSLWRSRDWLCELTVDDLQFSLQEAQAFFAQGSNGGLSAESIERIHARAEGWIAGLQLVKLSMDRADDKEQFVRSLSGDQRIFVDYLVDEALAQQPQAVRRFLAVTALFERFGAPLCDFVLSKGSVSANSREIIERLAHENLFLVALDRERHWYRYHNLFQNVLAQNSKLSEEELSQLHGRAGQWFAGEGLVEEALKHYLAAGDVDHAASLIEENFHKLVNEDLSPRELARWLANFPPQAQNRWPALLVAQAYLKMFTWDLPGMTLLVNQADTLMKDPKCSLDETRRRRLRGHTEAQRARCLYWQGDTKGALRHARHALRTVPRSHAYGRNTAVTYAAAAYALNGRRDEALRLLSRALAEDCAAGSRGAGHLLTARAAVYWYSGDLSAAEATAKQILLVHQTVPVADTWYGYAHFFLGCAAYEHNLLDTAAEKFGCGEQLRYRVSTRLYQEMLFGLALVAQAKDEAVRAKEYAASAHAFAVEMNDASSLQMAASFQIRLALLSGQAPSLPPERAVTIDSNKFWLEVPSLTRAEYLIRRALPGDCDAALELIDDALKRAKQYHNRRQVIQFLTVKVLALHGAGQTDKAVRLLKATLRMAEPQGVVRTFVERGPAMGELLQAVLKRSPRRVYLRRLTAAFRGEEVAKESGSEMSQNLDETLKVALAGDWARSQGLSEREIDVLTLIRERLSNKEIAQRLFIAPSTVKVHMRTIYRKLNVHKRREAAAIAAKIESGLPPRGSSVA